MACVSDVILYIRWKSNTVHKKPPLNLVWLALAFQLGGFWGGTQRGEVIYFLLVGYSMNYSPGGVRLCTWIGLQPWNNLGTLSTTLVCIKLPDLRRQDPGGDSASRNPSDRRTTHESRQKSVFSSFPHSASTCALFRVVTLHLLPWRRLIPLAWTPLRRYEGAHCRVPRVSASLGKGGMDGGLSFAFRFCLSFLGVV